MRSVKISSLVTAGMSTTFGADLLTWPVHLDSREAASCPSFCLCVVFFYFCNHKFLFLLHENEAGTNSRTWSRFLEVPLSKIQRTARPLGTEPHRPPGAILGGRVSR